MTLHWVLVALRLGIVAAGFVVGLWSLRMGIRSQGDRATYLLLAIGFGLLTLGSVVEGIVFELAGWSLLDSSTAEAFISAAGFAIILVSILRTK
ncbi:MAG TPA: hypothetical protein VJN63_04070 [Thermoplasmata archaeon]|nr:hypothetical protein [Thermoplasmata archaeon]